MWEEPKKVVVVAAPGATHGRPSLPPSCAAVAAGLAGPSPPAAPALRTCASSAGQPTGAASVEGAHAPGRRLRSPTPPLSRGDSSDMLEAPPPAAEPAGSTTEDGEDLFFAGVLGRVFDAVAAKMVAHVTVGYPPADLDSFSAAVHAGAVGNYINSAVVVRTDTANVVEMVTRLLGDGWSFRRGTVVSAQDFFSKAKAYALGLAG